MPTWLCTPGFVLLKRNIRPSRHDPLVDIVELIEANPLYAHVRFQTSCTTRSFGSNRSQPANQNSFEHGLDDVTMEIQNTVEETSNFLSEAELPPVNKYRPTAISHPVYS